MLKPSAFGTAVAVMLFLFGLSSASGRQWNATPEAINRDYASINDTRTNGELVLLVWLVPQLLPPETPGVAAIAPMLQKNVVLMAVHGKLDKSTGSMSFDDVTGLSAQDQTGAALTAIARDNLPPATNGMLAAIETMFRQSLGALGAGMKMFVFDGNSVSSCRTGRLTVALADENYVWNTPFPGCR